MLPSICWSAYTAPSLIIYSIVVLAQYLDGRQYVYGYIEREWRHQIILAFTLCFVGACLTAIYFWIQISLYIKNKPADPAVNYSAPPQIQPQMQQQMQQQIQQQIQPQMPSPNIFGIPPPNGAFVVAVPQHMPLPPPPYGPLPNHPYNQQKMNIPLGPQDQPQIVQYGHPVNQYGPTVNQCGPPENMVPQSYPQN